MIQITCRCGAPYSLGDHLAGRSFRCTRCQAVISLPAAGLAPPPAYAPPPPAYAPPGYAPPLPGPPLPLPPGGAPGAARWGSSGTLGAIPGEPAPAPPPVTGPAKKKKKRPPLPGEDEEDSLAMRPSEDSDVIRMPDTLELAKDAPPERKAKDPDLLESSFELNSTEDDGGIENSVETSSERGRRSTGKSAEKARRSASGRSPLEGSAERARKKGSGRTKTSSARTKKKGPPESAEGPSEVGGASGENRFARDCPVCEATIARSAKVCPSCGVALASKGGLSDSQKQLLGGLAKGAGAVLLVAVLVFAWKSMKEDTGTGQPGGGKKPKSSPSPAASKIPGPDKSPDQSPGPAASPGTPGPKPSPTSTPDAPSPAPSAAPSVAPSAAPTRAPSPEPDASPAPAMKTSVPDGPLKGQLEALRDAADLPAVEGILTDLAGKPELGSSVAAIERTADPAFRARLLRALLAGPDVPARKAAADRAFASSDLVVVVAGLEWSVENEGPDDTRARLGSLRARELGVVLEGLMNALQGASEAPSPVAVDAARAFAEGGGPELSARLSPLLLAGGDGAGLAAAPDALVASSKKLRKAALRGLKLLSKDSKLAKDPLADGEGARAEWVAWTGAYAPARAVFARACADVAGDRPPADAFAAAMEARAEILAKRRDMVVFLPQFAREAIVKTPAGGAALGEIILRIATPADREVLNQVIEAQGEDSRGGAPPIVAACLRAGDRDVAAAAAKAVDRSAVSLRDVASLFPDLLEPATAPKSAQDGGDALSLQIMGMFRDVALDKKILEQPKNKLVLDDAISHAGSPSLEKHLLAIYLTKEKATARFDDNEAKRVLGECGTRALATEILSLAQSSTYDQRVLGLASVVERCGTSDQAIACVKVAEKWKDKDPSLGNNWLRTAAHLARGTDARETVGRALHAHAKVVPSPSPLPKGSKATPPPAPPAPPADPLRTTAFEALADLQGEFTHEEASRKLGEWHADVAKAAGGPPTDQLALWARSVSADSAKQDVTFLTQCMGDASFVRSKGDQDKVQSWAILNLVRLKAAGEPALVPIRERFKQGTGPTDVVKGQAAAALGALKDASAADLFHAVLDPPDERAKTGLSAPDLGALVGLAALRPSEGAVYAGRFLAAAKALTPDNQEALFFALARGTTTDESRPLTAFAHSPDASVRASVARAIGYAGRAGGAGPLALSLLDRLRMDPQALVRVEAAIALMDASKDSTGLWDGALALEADKDLLAKKTRHPVISLVAGADPEATLYQEIVRAFERAAKGSVKLDALNAQISAGRLREVIRVARAGARRGG